MQLEGGLELERKEEEIDNCIRFIPYIIGMRISEIRGTILL